MFQKFLYKQIVELRPYKDGEDLSNIIVSVADRADGSPKIGDMIARNPKNSDDQWLVEAAYFVENFKPT